MMRLDKVLFVGKVFDVHTHSTGIMQEHLLKARYPIVQDLVDLSETIRRNEVDYAITFPMPLSLYYDSSKYWDEKLFVANGICDFPFQVENMTLLHHISDFGLNNLLPFLAVSSREKVSTQINFIKQMNKEYPVYGLKYHTTMDQRSIMDISFEPFAELALEMDIPLMIHTKMTDTADPMHVIQFAEKYPNLRICAAHGAKLYAPFFEALKKKKYPNLYLDCAPFLRICSIQESVKSKQFLQMNYANPAETLKILVEDEPRRWLWGTDMPWHRYKRADGSLSTYVEETEVLNKSGLREVFSENTIRFLFGT